MLSHVGLSVIPWTSPWNSPGQNTRVGSLSLLQGIFPTQGSNPGLLHCRRILLPAEPPGKPTEDDRGSIVRANSGMSFKLSLERNIGFWTQA